MTIDDARALDAADPLRPYRDRFRLPEGLIYLDGNSLGCLPHATVAAQRDAVERQWGEQLIGSWNKEGWIDAPARIAGKIAPLIGADAHEVLVADSTSVNLYKALAAAVALRPGRREIVTELGNFPSDLYVAGAVPGADVRAVPPGEVEAALGPNSAVLLLTQVHYKTGERRDITALTARAHDAGALAVWDLSHSVGAVPLALSADGADFAVGCGYKFLNGGPGAPAFIFAAARHHDAMRSPLQGWFGHAAPFAFPDDYAPAPGVARFACGTPPMLSLLALESGVENFAGADMAALFAKSAALFDLFAGEVDARCPALRLASPRDRARRGSQISFAHPHAYEICQALIAAGVVGDFRAPDILRFGLTPLYTGFEDVWSAVDRLASILDNETWRDPHFAKRAKVT
ncbi:MAG TPA: kynureninase [Sphingomonadaceae bacterium]|nr:kynureninase [Sphingomonadaceae bacterium]